MNLEILTKEIQRIIITFGLFMIMVWFLTMLLVWFFIKSAVREGVKEALQDNVINVNLHGVKKGITIDTRDVTPRNYDTWQTENQLCSNRENEEIYRDMPFLE